MQIIGRSSPSAPSNYDTVTNIDHLLDNVNSSQAKVGALSNRQTQAVNSMTITLSNSRSSRSVILDTDYVADTAQLIKAQVTL